MKKEIVIGIVNSERNKGYSSSATSLVNVSENTRKMTFDLADDEIEDIITTLNEALEKQNSLKIISSGDMGIDIFNYLLTDANIKKFENKIQFILTSDKYYSIPLDMKKITLIMPNVAINEFKEKNPDTKITSYPADFVATPSKEELQNRAKSFDSENKWTDMEILRHNSFNTRTFAFIGGRVSDGKGGWKENTPEIFERAAKDYMEAIKGDEAGFVVFHGLRSFTNAKGENDFKPAQKFYETVKSMIEEKQRVAFLTKSDDGKGEDGKYKRSSIFKMIGKENGEIHDWDIKISENTPAGGYYWLLNEATKFKDKYKYLFVTGEQMNFTPEAIEMGASLSDIYYYNWELTVPSNIATQNDIINYYKENNRKYPMDAVKAFKKLLSDEKQMEMAALSQARNR